MFEIDNELVQLYRKKDKIKLKAFIKDNIYRINISRLYSFGHLDCQLFKFLVHHSNKINLSYYFLYFIKIKVLGEDHDDANRIKLLNFILKECVFDNDFILKLLLMYEKRLAITNKELDDIVSQEINKANINKQDDDGNTPLHIACLYHYDKIIEFLINNGANLNIEDNKGNTPILSYLNNKDDTFNENQVKTIQYFVEHGMDLHKNTGNELLHRACYNLNYELIKYLIEHGANSDATNSIIGNRPLMTIIYAFVSKYRQDHHKLFNTLWPDFLKIVKFLISLGASVNTVNDIGETPFLHFSHDFFSNPCLLRNEACVNLIDYFIEIGANVNTRDRKKQTILHYACQYGNKRHMNYLIEKGADPNTEDHEGKTPLFIACSNNNTDCIEYLVEFGVDINKEDREGRTPLFIVCLNNNEKYIKYLVEHGANPNKKDRQENTPLSILCKNNFLDGIKYLIEHGVDLNVLDRERKTPLEIIIDEFIYIGIYGYGFYNSHSIDPDIINNFLKTIETLIQHGAVINEKNKRITVNNIKKFLSRNEILYEYLMKIVINSTENTIEKK